MAATPITALLVTAYFQAYGKFDHRFPMYDLLLKFILIKVWENIKTDAFPYKNLELFFKEIKKTGFFEKYKDAGVMYDGLGSLCFRLFFDGAEGKVQRQVNEETLKRHFTQVISENFRYDEGKVASFVEQWIEQFQQDHLMLQAGAGEFVFIHSTVMEYLAAFHMVQQIRKDSEKLPVLVQKALKKEDYLRLETLPIAAGNDLLKGFGILSELRRTNVEYERQSLLELGIKCLAEVEWQITKTFQAIRIESLKKPVLDIIRQNREAVDWLYLYLKELVLSPDKDNTGKNIEGFDTVIKMSRRTFLEEFLDYEAFDSGDSELVDLRKQLLFKLVQKERVEEWIDIHKGKEEVTLGNILQLDTPGYHPEDKNFNYYRNIVGKELAGFFGSPNLKHSGAVNGCAISPDGKYVVSASSDQTLTLWDVESGKHIRTFSGHKDRVLNCALSADGKRLVSASYDQTLTLWEVESGKHIRTFSGHKGYVYSCALSAEGKRLVSASYDQTLKLWEVESGKLIRTFSGHKGRVWGCVLSADGKGLVSASDDHTLKLWEVESGKLLKSLDLPWLPFHVSISPTNPSFVITANLNGTLTLFDFSELM